MAQKSLYTVKVAIEGAIELLQSVKKTLTESNYGQFEILINQHRDLDPIMSVGEMSPIGFEQTGPDIISITVNNYCNDGKRFIDDLKSDNNS